MINLLEHENALWAFPLAIDLQSRVRQIAVDFSSDSIDRATLPKVREDFVVSLNAVIDSGFDFYYVQPSQRNNTLSPMARKTVDSIIGTVRGAIHLVVQRLFKKMSQNDLQLMAYYLDSMVVERPDAKNDEYRFYLVFPLDDAVRVKLAGVLEKVKNSEAIDTYASDLAAVFMEIVRESAHFYYHLPTEFISINRIARKAADVGIDSTVKGVQRIIKRVIKDISHKEVMLLTRNLHNFVFTADVPYEVCVPRFAEGK